MSAKKFAIAILHEGLETPGQRAYYFASLKDDEESSSGSFDKPMDNNKFKQLGTAQMKNANQNELAAAKLYRSHPGFLDKSMRGYTESEKGKSSDIYSKTADNLHSLVSKSELPESVSVYRGAGPIEFKDIKAGSDLKVGSEVGGRGFVSARQDVETAANDSQHTGSKGSEFKVFQYNLPKGHSALALGHDQSDPYQKEVLMNPEKFTVTKIETRELANKPFPGNPNPAPSKYTVYHLSPSKSVKGGK